MAKKKLRKTKFKVNVYHATPHENIFLFATEEEIWVDTVTDRIFNRSEKLDSLLNEYRADYAELDGLENIMMELVKDGEIV